MAWGEVLAGGMIAVASSGVTGWLALKGQRGQRAHELDIAAAAQRHERDVAAAARRRDDLRSVYPDVLRFVISEQVNMYRTKPTFGQEGQRVPPLDDDAALDLQARVYAYASESLKTALDELLQLRRRFEIDAQELSYAQEHPSPDVSTPKLYNELDALRRDYHTKLEAMRVVVRDELSR